MPRSFNNYDPSRVENLLVLYDHLGGDERLDEAFRACMLSLAGTEDTPITGRLARWKILKASALRFLFERDGTRSSLDEAGSLLADLVSSNEPGSITHTHAVYELGRISETLYDCYGKEEHIQPARSSYEEAMTHAEGVLRDDVAVHLASTLRLSAEYIDKSSDNSDAIGIVADIVKRTNDSNPAKPFALGCLASSYTVRYIHHGHSDKDDLVKSEHLLRHALALAPAHRLTHRLLHRLSGSCNLLYISGGSIEYLQEALELCRRSVELCRSSRWVKHDDLKCFAALAISLNRKFGAEGRLEDLSEAIEHQKYIANNTKPGVSWQYFNLCVFLSLRFRATGQLVDVDDAISAGYRALEVSSEDSPLYPHALVCLGWAFGYRFAYRGDKADYQAAQRLLEDAADRCQTKGLGSSVLGQCLGALAEINTDRFKITNSLADLDQAIHYCQKVVTSVRTASIDGPYETSELGELLQERYKITADINDLTAAISCHEEAARLPLTAAGLKYLLPARYSPALRLRFEVLHSDEDINRSIQAMHEALEYVQRVHHPKSALYQTELATCLIARYRVHMQKADLGMALACCKQAAEEPLALVDHRLQAAIMGARIAQEHGRVFDAMRAFGSAVSLLGRVAWTGLNTGRRHAKLISVTPQLACEAAATAITCQELERAVELLDEGRSVLWRSLLQLRTDTQELKRAAPEIAAELLAVAQALDHDDATEPQQSEVREEQRAQRRRRIAERWEALLISARQVPGFQSFLKPLPFAELRRAADDGPVVILNVSVHRSDALIVARGCAVRCIPLRGLDHGTVTQLCQALSAAHRVAKDAKGFRFAEQVLLKVARQLWAGGLCAVADVLSELKYPMTGGARRIWWVPTGLFSHLPVHCAGPHQDGRNGLADLFQSSYTSTLSALLIARAPLHAHKRPFRMLAIAQPQTPGLPELQSATAEMQILASSAFAPSVDYLFGANATVDAVKRALSTHSWIHCCCHGSWDPVSPLNSAFKLQDGSLTLSAIIQMRIKDGAFAYLSACHTARQAENVPDESLHLCAALQIAGFRGSLATMWAMADRDGPVLARQFYRCLTADDRPVDARNAADAMHRALNALRKTGTPLYRWATFIHYGI